MAFLIQSREIRSSRCLLRVVLDVFWGGCDKLHFMMTTFMSRLWSRWFRGTGPCSIPYLKFIHSVSGVLCRQFFRLSCLLAYSRPIHLFRGVLLGFFCIGHIARTFRLHSSCHLGWLFAHALKPLLLSFFILLGCSWRRTTSESLLLLSRPDLETKKRRGGRRIRRLKEVSGGAYCICVRGNFLFTPLLFSYLSRLLRFVCSCNSGSRRQR